MGRQQSRNTPFKLSDYSQTTEPMERIVLPLYTNPTYTVGGASPDSWTIPAAQADARPVPQDASPVYPYYPPSQPDAYPILPPSPLKEYRGQPPGGSSPFSQPERSRRRHHSLIPGLMGLFFLLVQIALLARVVCMLLNVQNTTLWLTLLFAASDLFVQPVRWLAMNINLSFLAGTQLLTILEFLLAALAYGIFSRLLVRLLKALLNY